LVTSAVRWADAGNISNMLGELIPCGGGDPIPLLKPSLIVGRRSSSDICLRFPNVSSHHCSLDLVNGYWSVRDLGSRNGIKVNGFRCESKFLMPGDVLSVAKHRYEVVYVPRGDAPPPEDDNPFEIGLMEKAGLMRRKPTEPPPPPRTRYTIDEPPPADEEDSSDWAIDVADES
jgi:adenylate cyclase